MPTKNECITAIKWYFDMSTKAAEKYYRELVREGNTERLKLMVDGFKANARKSFYED